MIIAGVWREWHRDGGNCHAELVSASIVCIVNHSGDIDNYFDPVNSIREIDTEIPISSRTGQVQHDSGLV